MEKIISKNDISLKKNSKDKRERKIDVITSYIFQRPEKIQKLWNIYNKVINLLTEYCSLSQIYSNKLKELAINIRLDEENEDQNLPEAKLFNVIRAIIFFNSESLKETTNNIKKQINSINNENFIKTNEIFNILSKTYFEEIDNVILNQKKYERKMKLYEELLIKQELEKNKEEKLINNLKEAKGAIKSQETYFKSVKDSNNILRKIMDVSLNAKTKLRQKINQKFLYIIDSLIFLSKIQNENNELQKVNLKDAYSTDSLISKEEEELNNNFLLPIPYSLKSINMYINKKEKKKIKDVKEIDDFLFLSLFNDPNLEEEKKIKNKMLLLKSDNILEILDIINKNKLVLSSKDEKMQKNEISKKSIKQILTIIFKENNKYDNKQKNKLFKLFDEGKEHIMYFLKILNCHRAKDISNIHKNTFIFLGEAFEYITKISLGERDIEILRLLFILSLTYYYKENNKKRYLFEFIEKFPEFKEPDFWENYYENFINYEFKKSPQIYEDINEKNKTNEEMVKNKIDKNSITLFTSLLMVINNMIDFKLDKDNILKLISKINDKYKLNDEYIEQAKILLDDKINEEEKSRNINSKNNNSDKLENNIIHNSNICKNNNINDNLINEISVINDNNVLKNEIIEEINNDQNQ